MVNHEKVLTTDEVAELVELELGDSVRYADRVLELVNLKLRQGGYTTLEEIRTAKPYVYRRLQNLNRRIV